MRSSKLKLTRLIIVSALCVSFTMTHAQVKLIDQVVAKVGSEYILLSDVEEEYSYAKSKNPSLNEDVKCAILDNLIAQKLIVYQAKLDSVEVSDSEVEAQLNYRFDAILQQMNGDEAFFEEYYGASVNEMKDRYREDQKQKILAERMQDKLMADIEITPKEVEAFFNKILRTLCHTTNQKWKFQK